MEIFEKAAELKNSNQPFVIATIKRPNPRQTTTAAPVGKSRLQEIQLPIRQIIIPLTQLIARRLIKELPNKIPITAGTIKNPKTIKTPAILTANVTNKPSNA